VRGKNGNPERHLKKLVNGQLTNKRVISQHKRLGKQPNLRGKNLERKHGDGKKEKGVKGRGERRMAKP